MSERTTRFLFITGGVVSSLGKGIAAASTGLLLKESGLKVSLQKFDPYLNLDPGTMSPYQHGEVFVTDDGAETDLDLGHYERFIDQALTRDNCITAGQIYDRILSRERRGDFLGKTVQVIPHVTDEIKRAMTEHAKRVEAEVDIIEIGGTVGDIESLPFLESIRQLRLELGRQRTLFIHLTLVPYIKAARELKTKPTQHSVRELREIGIQPDILLCRTEVPLGPEVRQKIALFCNVSPEAVIEAPDVPSIYEVPLMFHRGGLDRIVFREFGLEPARPLDLRPWEDLVHRIRDVERTVTIAICGKYTYLHDAYKSIVESMIHAGAANAVRVDTRWIESEEVEKQGPEALLEDVDGLLVPGGFGERGIEGMVMAIRYVRERKIPFFGICLGLQCATIEFARHVAGLDRANSTEFDRETPHPVIDLLPGQEHGGDKGGTMRLGAYPCRLAEGSRAREAYEEAEIRERHRHRFEFNNAYRERLTRAGMLLAGICPENDLVEIVEIPEHPWFVGVQFHPELRSRPRRPHPLFREFVRAALERKLRRAHD
ncbi:MAG: CTP synthase [Candidatus Eisenbacteria bacterium]|nr:CTP synthase [Candidatus Eisenbacteria bacterium]